MCYAEEFRVYLNGIYLSIGINNHIPAIDEGVFAYNLFIRIVKNDNHAADRNRYARTRAESGPR